MKNQEAISLLIDKLNHFQSEGFIIEPTNEGLSFNKTNGETNYKFGVRILRNPEHSRLVSINAGINFKEIEQAIIPILQKAEIVGQSMNHNTSITIGINSEEDLFSKMKLQDDKLPIEIRQEDDTEKVAKLIRNTYDEILTQFFKRYHTTEDLFLKIKDKSYRDIASIITTGGVFKYFFLADKFNKTETEEKMKLWLNGIDNAVENNPDEIQYKRFMNAGKILANKLKYAM